MRADLHTHTTYSHGRGSIADNAAKAAELGLERLGISDHGPGSLSYGIDMNKIPQMRKDIGEAGKLFPQLKIELGVEANIANLSGRLDIGKEEQKLFDAELESAVKAVKLVLSVPLNMAMNEVNRREPAPKAEPAKEAETETIKQNQ